MTAIAELHAGEYRARPAVMAVLVKTGIGGNVGADLEDDRA